MKTRTVRELSGEIWAEINYYFMRTGRHIEIVDLTAITDIAMGVLARHVGVEIKNDEGLPVSPLEKIEHT